MSALSYWHDSLASGDTGAPRPPLPASTAVDVAIVGAGFSGLWTAYYLLCSDPTLRVVVLERDTAGFGASGRNGGWCVGDQAAPLPALEKAAGDGAAHAMVQEVHDAVDEVGAVAEREGIDCGYAKGGALYLATNRQQLRRLAARRSVNARYGHGDAFELLGPRDATARVNATGLHGALFTPHAAAVHPARLVRGLADAVERLGGVVHELTAVRSLQPGVAVTERGDVRAEVVVRATEAYTSTLEGGEGEVLAIGNHVIATDPIPDSAWAEIGLAGRELFEDSTTLLGYGQRTADGRIVWGGLSAPTWYGSRLPAARMEDRRVAARLHALLVRRFPVLEGIGVSHRWGGVLGATRDLRPGLGLDRATGLAWIGGYFGSGVAASNAAGRALADVITGADTDRSRLAWVGHRSRRWEPEPLRWLGVHAVTTAAKLSDRLDRYR